MELTPYILPYIAVFIAIGLCIKDFRHAFLPKLLTDKPFQNFCFFTTIGLFFLWSAQAGVKEGLLIHFLGLTIFTLIFGMRTAFLLTIPIAFALAITTQIPFDTLAEYLFLSCLIPISVSYGIYYLSFHYLPKNIFIFIFVAGFLNGALTGSVHLLTNTGYQLWQGNYDWQTISDNYFIFLPLLAFPEGLLNGMAAAIMAVFKPEWLRTFSDKDYIYTQYRK
ncbi:energy-coupling factor ABC transporter permease [Vibrio hannami]|uniref:energy-coupling factor ABC transporter permease n=1 Tax=Vibrio hannami TaxID=2717094 RepID=UPI00241090FD|nr:energy-coupling factor ABC transporter permease [Vibrio hannami]MDG3088391.1 energy-coupling factor ABC transporter permease [Vibrio hannami]